MDLKSLTDRLKAKMSVTPRLPPVMVQGSFLVAPVGPSPLPPRGGSMANPPPPPGHDSTPTTTTLPLMVSTSVIPAEHREMTIANEVVKEQHQEDDEDDDDEEQTSDDSSDDEEGEDEEEEEGEEDEEENENEDVASNLSESDRAMLQRHHTWINSQRELTSGLNSATDSVHALPKISSADGIPPQPTMILFDHREDRNTLLELEQSVSFSQQFSTSGHRLAGGTSPTDLSSSQKVPPPSTDLAAVMGPLIRKRSSSFCVQSEAELTQLKRQTSFQQSSSGRVTFQVKNPNVDGKHKQGGSHATPVSSPVGAGPVAGGGFLGGALPNHEASRSILEAFEEAPKKRKMT